jgi:predicted amidophosphoribosyltransferase
MSKGGSQQGDTVFVPEGSRYNRPGRIVTLGHYYPQDEVQPAYDLLRSLRSARHAETTVDASAIRRHLEWTKLLTALMAERQWPLKHLVKLLDPQLAPDIAIAVVPTHLAYQAFWPVRTLAQQLATEGRTDATGCLVRQTTIRRITFGGPSTKAIHRATIRVEDAHLVAGKRVLLLDDIAKSGNSLLACQEMLLEAGATTVQAMALGRVILGSREPT